MKTLIVTDSFPPSFGGVERHTYTLSKYLNSQGVDVTILTDAIDNDDSELIELGITIKRSISFDHRDAALKWPYQYIQNSRKVKDAVNEHGNDYDVVHYHGTNMLFGHDINIETPIVATLHGIFPVCIAFWGIEKWCGKKPSSISCALCMAKIRGHYIPLIPGMALYNSYYYKHMKKSLKKMDKIIAVSDYVRDVVKSSFELNNISTIYNFIDIQNELTPNIEQTANTLRDLALDESSKIILYSARLHHQKGILTLLDAFEQDRIDENISVMITGTGELESIVRIRTKNRKDIRYLGFLPRRTQINLLNKSAVFAAPSNYPDACPTSIIEAMALGVPVVSTNMGGIPELIVDGETGYLIDPNDSETLKSKALDSINVTKDFWREKCMKQAQKFDINVIGEKIIQTYKEMI